MAVHKNRIAATDARLKEMKDARKVADKTRRQQVRQTRADRERKITLVREAVMRRLGRGEWDEADFRQMMDESLSRPADRALFDLN
jgi:hypothetical protein